MLKLYMEHGTVREIQGPGASRFALHAMVLGLDTRGAEFISCGLL